MNALNRAPLITAIVLLLLPVLYVGSYLAMVAPSNCYAEMRTDDLGNKRFYYKGYRAWDESRSGHVEIAPVIFWPLEQIDRRVRPGAWE